MDASGTPERLIRRDEARRRFGGLVDRIAPALLRSDPLADRAMLAADRSPRRAMESLQRTLTGETTGVAPEFVELTRTAARLPVWVDEARLRRAGELLFRAGAVGGLALGAKSLLSGYASPAGNKPLIWAGGLRSNVRRRIAETARFVAAVAEPGGILPGGDGFEITLRVRLMHAQVRSLIQQKGAWPTELWGAPINQHDMMATILLFSAAWLDGVEKLGLRVTAQEAEDYVHLWRTVGHVIGVDGELLPATRAEAERLLDFIDLTQAPPDEDARSLVHAFLHHPTRGLRDPGQLAQVERRMRAYAGIVRGLLGDRTADGLGLPRDAWSLLVPTIRPVVQRAERVREWVPGGRAWAVRAGRTHWARVVETSLSDRPALFDPPSQLARAMGS